MYHSMCACMYWGGILCACVCMYDCVNIYIVCACVCMCTYVCVCICMHFMCMNMYIIILLQTAAVKNYHIRKTVVSMVVSTHSEVGYQQLVTTLAVYSVDTYYMYVIRVSHHCVKVPSPWV